MYCNETILAATKLKHSSQTQYTNRKCQTVTRNTNNQTNLIKSDIVCTFLFSCQTQMVSQCTIAHKLNSYPTKRSEANRIRYYLFCLYYLLLIDFSRFSSLVLSIDVIILFFSYKIIISILNNNQKIELNSIDFSNQFSHKFFPLIHTI